MCYLAEEDKQCFKCILPDCSDKNKACLRQVCIRNRIEIKRAIRKHKMKTNLKLKEPIVVR